MVRMNYEQAVDLATVDMMVDIGSEAHFKAIAEAIPGGIEDVYWWQSGGFCMVLCIELTGGKGTVQVTDEVVGFERREAEVHGPCYEHEGGPYETWEGEALYTFATVETGTPLAMALAVQTLLGRLQRPDLERDDVRRFVERTWGNTDLDIPNGECYDETFGEFSPPFCNDCKGDA